MNIVERIPAAKASELVYIENIAYSNTREAFSTITQETIEDFKNFIFYSIYRYASFGNESFEFQLNTNLREKFPEFLKELENLKYEVNVYELNSNYEDRRFNLIISW